MNITTDEMSPSLAELGSLTEDALRVLIGQDLVKGWVARGRPGGFCPEVVLGDKSSRVLTPTGKPKRTTEPQ